MKKLYLLLFILLIACTPETDDFPEPPPSNTPDPNAAATPTPEPTLPPAKTDALLEALNEAEAEWLVKNIGDYRIVVTTISFWHMQTHTIVIRFGEIAEATATCNPAPLEAGPCEVSDFDPQTFTVSGLFAQARAVAQSEEGRWTTITFDPIYHFPNQISYTNPTLTDADFTWNVDEFQPVR